MIINITNETEYCGHTRTGNKIKKTPCHRICGAKTRNGQKCLSIDLLRGGRCRIHGGLSTGPKTLKGRKISAQNIGKTYEALLEKKLAKFKNPALSAHYAHARA